MVPLPRDNTELLQRKESKAKRNLLSSETSRWQNKVSLSTPCCAMFPTFCPQQPRDPWLGLCAWFPSATKPPHFYIGLGFIWRKSLDYHHLTLWCLCAVWLWVQQGGRGDAPGNSQIPVGDASSPPPLPSPLHTLLFPSSASLPSTLQPQGVGRGPFCSHCGQSACFLPLLRCLGRGRKSEQQTPKTCHCAERFQTLQDVTVSQFQFIRRRGEDAGTSKNSFSL